MFANRQDAGRRLADKLSSYGAREDVVVLALPRGGVPVAFEVSRALQAPLDIFIVRKIGVPGHEELAMGAIASGGTVVRNEDVISYVRISEDTFHRVCAEEEQEISRRERQYRGAKRPVDVSQKTVIVVDDGIATGASMQAAVVALRRHRPRKIVVAAPVAATQACVRFALLADAVVCVLTPDDLQAVGAWYSDFSQTSDEQVRYFLDNVTLNNPRWRSDEEIPPVTFR